MNNLGFRKNYSTSHGNTFDWYAVVGDVEKAFNCERHDALLNKLLEYRFPMVYIKIIWSFLTHQKFYVTLARERSAECGVSSGVPQDAVLSPTLFNIFTSDFPTLTDVSLPI
jgi:hypothetical protein